MNKRTASLLVLVVIALLASFVPLSQSAAAQATGRRVSPLPRKKAPSNPPPTSIGFLSATQIAAGGGTYSPFPAVMGDFNGDGKPDVATIVNTVSNAKPKQAISVILSNGDGTFTNVLTPTTYTSVVFNPIWVGDLDGVKGDDIVVGIQATTTTPASIDVYLSNGDGTFAAPVNYVVTAANDVMVWGTLIKHGGTGALDFVAADAASPNGSIWTLTGKSGGTFNTPATSVAFTGALQPGDPTNANSFSPIVFADFDGANGLDFAAPALTTNQIAVYLNTGSAYTGPTLLSTPNHLYDSCYLGSGSLSGNLDLVAANCYDNRITVWVNNGTGTFGAGKYYPVSTLAGVVPSAVSIADIDGDGKNDVVSSNWQGADVTVLLGDGTGALSDPGLGYAIGGGAHINAALTPAVVADFNGDGLADMILQDSEFSFVYLQNFANTPPTPPSFRSTVDYSVPVLDLSNSVGIASGDFNGDGIPDFVVGSGNVTNPTTLGVTVFLSSVTDSGTLQPGVSYLGSTSLTNPQFQYVAVADFDGDGKLDIAATDSVSGVLQIFIGDGTGKFTADPTTFPVGTAVSALGIAVGDFNGDKKPDLAVVTNTGTASANVAILTNSSTGAGNFGFTLGPLQPLSTLATEITVADLNKDGNLDLVVPLWGYAPPGTPGTAVAVMLGNGDGTFTGKPDLSLGLNNPYYAAVGDFDGDGNVDLAVTIEDQTTGHTQGIAVATGKGDGSFNPPTLFATSLQNVALDVPFPGYVKAVDLNRDGKLDLVYTNKKYGTVGILYGAGDSTLFPYTPLEFAAGAKAYDIALADINGGSALDVVTSSNARDFVGVTVLLNTSGNITTLTASPTSLTRGTSVTFTAKVAAAVNGVTTAPTGTVTFTDNGTIVLGTQPLDGSGNAALQTVSLVTGSNSVVAQYSGDPNYVPSASMPAVVTVTGQTASKTTVTSSVNPAGLGQFITFTATVTSTVSDDTVIPTGTVTFNDGTTALGSPVALDASGVAKLTTSTLAAGTHSITGAYNGDPNFSKSTGAVSPPQVVNSQPSTATNLTSSLNPAPVGQTVTFTARVSSTVVGDKRIPTGTVTFRDGSTQLGVPVQLNNGVAAVDTTFATVGLHDVTGVYSGDTTFTGSTGTLSPSQDVTPGPDYTLTAAPTSATVSPGGAPTFTITVTPINGYNGVVSFSASSCTPTSLPPQSTCSFSKASVTGSGTTTLTITTTGPTAVLRAPANVNRRQGGLNLWASLTGVGVLGMILAGDGKKQKRRIGIVLTILAIVMLVALVGCGGGSSSGGGGGGGGTPAGSYTIHLNVTGTVNKTPHDLKTPITLTVN